MSTGTEADAGMRAPAATTSGPTPRATPAYPVDARETAADRFMRRLLRVRRTDRNLDAGAHRRLRLSLVVSAVRCLVTYVLIPVLVPLLSVAGVLAAPVGIALCAVAVVSGISALRRFWATDHKGRWMYTGFIAVVFLVLAVGLVADVSHLVTA
ncbi:MAG: hypothetical protein ACTHXO_00465 [Actinomycetaceae bacterium]